MFYFLHIIIIIIIKYFSQGDSMSTPFYFQVVLTSTSFCSAYRVCPTRSSVTKSCANSSIRRGEMTTPWRVSGAGFSWPTVYRCSHPRALCTSFCSSEYIWQHCIQCYVVSGNTVYSVVLVVNDNTVACERGWLLMANCLSVFPPLGPLYKCFVHLATLHTVLYW